MQITNKAMGSIVAVDTNEAGSYQAAFLLPGLYTITVDTPGFKKYVRDDFEVRINERLELIITMEVGTAEQSITVIGETPLLSTASASMGQIVDSRRVAELPIAHGQPFALVGLAPGISFNASAATSTHLLSPPTSPATP